MTTTQQHDFDIGETVEFTTASGRTVAGTIVCIVYKGHLPPVTMSVLPYWVAEYDCAAVRITSAGTPWGRGYVMKDVPLARLTWRSDSNNPSGYPKTPAWRTMGLFMVWAYVPGLVASTSDLHPSYLDTAPCVTSRGKPMPPQSLQRAWANGGWIRHLSGLTCSPSTADRGVAEWISSLPATHVSHSAWPASAAATPTLDTYGHTSPASSKRSSQLSLFSRTSQDTSPWVWTPSQQTFKQWVTVFRQASSVLSKSARHTCENDSSSLLPTPTANSYGSNQGGAAGRQGKVRHSLESMARQNLWPTPTASDASHGGPGQRYTSGGTGLTAAVRQQWPTPTVGDASGRGYHYNGKDKNGTISMSLPEAVGGCHVPTGKGVDPPTRQTGSLSPLWTEWLMGFPIGWTDCGR